ncbi:MAG: hypothetical protein ABSE16_20065 [Verrucomicrobiota bacterium]|jgi:hypothetical protein
MKVLLWSVLVCLGASAVVRADPTIGFDDLPPDQLPVPVGYHELNWSNLYYLDGVDYPGNPSGYQAGVVSPNDVIYNAFASTGVISGVIFDFISAYATAAWNDNLQFEAQGYINGTLVYDQTNILSATAPTLIYFNFYGVDEVHLLASGGTQHAAYTNGAGEYFAVDNVSVVTYVPYAPDLLVNGDFETGDFTGWFNFGDTNYTWVTNSAFYLHSGQYGVQIGPDPTPGYLSQSLAPTEIGELYSLSFWLENFEAGDNLFNLYWGGFPMLALTNMPAFGWTNFQLNIAASTTSEYLEFGFLNFSSYFGFDDVSVTPALLVSNGGFETDDFSGWTQSGNSAKDAVTAIARRAGSYGASFGASGSPGFISQPITTYPGQPYLVSLWLDSPDGQTPNQFEVTWGGQTLMNQTNLGAIGWTNLHFTVMNSSTQTTLTFGLRDDPSSLGLDEVTVVPIPLLQNGGFEFGDFTGWTTSGDFEDCLVTTNTTYVDAGFYGGEFAPVGSLGYISQTVATIPGLPYVVGFDFYNPTNMLDTPVTEFTVSWNGTTLMDTTNSDLVGWFPYQFLVTASATSSTIQFGFRDDALLYLGLDQVYVSAISPPVIESVTKTNNLINLSWSALPGYSYQLQYCTRLSQTNWTNLQDFPFPAGSPIIFTDTNPPDAYRFYRVLMLPPPAG